MVIRVRAFSCRCWCVQVRYVLKNLARDWGADGAAERAQAYDRIKAALRSAFDGWPADAPRPPRVLLPGAGLGRLCCEVRHLQAHLQQYGAAVAARMLSGQGSVWWSCTIMHLACIDIWNATNMLIVFS